MGRINFYPSLKMVTSLLESNISLSETMSTNCNIILNLKGKLNGLNGENKERSLRIHHFLININGSNTGYFVAINTTQ